VSVEDVNNLRKLGRVVVAFAILPSFGEWRMWFIFNYQCGKNLLFLLPEK